MARLPGIHHDDRAALAAKLQRRRQTRSRSADDGHVAMTFDASLVVLVHEQTIEPPPTATRERATSHLPLSALQQRMVRRFFAEMLGRFELRRPPDFAVDDETHARIGHFIADLRARLLHSIC